MNQLEAIKNFISGVVICSILLPFTPTRPVVPDPDPQPSLQAAITYQGDGNQAPKTHGCGEEHVGVLNLGYEQEVLRLVNEHRANNDIPPLKRVDDLDEAARYHSTDLGEDDYFDHDSYDRLNNDLIFVCGPWDRIATYYNGARGENIAAGYATPEAVVNAWMNSPGHRSNILSASNWEIGIGYYDGNGAYYAYWTQDFGRRSGVYPLVINDDAIATENHNVALYIYGSWSELRLRNDTGEWSPWLPFQNRLDWELPDVVGDHLVTAELRDASQTVTTSDSIYLSTATSIPEPILGEITDTITITYLISASRIVPASIQITPLNTGSSDALEWELVVEGSWFVVSPTHGVTPQAFTITPLGEMQMPEAAMSGKITVSIVAPVGVKDSPQDVELNLQVISGEIRDIFIPLLIKPNP